MSSNNYRNLYLDAGITHNQESFDKRLDAVLENDGITVEDIIGVGEKDSDLCVVHRQAVTLASEGGIFNRRIGIQPVGPIPPVERLVTEVEGFKGRDGLSIIAYDTSGTFLWKLNWGLGGPNWVVPMAERQSQHLFAVISQAMDRASEPPSRPSVALASSKAGALMDWAADVVKASGVQITNERVNEHANMAAATIRIYEFMRLGAPFGIDDLGGFFPDGQVPSGTPLETFDDLYQRVVARVGSPQIVDRAIDRYLTENWAEFVRGCRETYS